eukprot:9541434-Heterocapsa_arctica.AAC.1
MPSDTLVITPDASPTDAEAGPGNRTGTPEIGAVPSSPPMSLTVDNENHEETEVEVEDDEVEPVEDHEVEPDPLPPPLIAPPWIDASADTNAHLLEWYLPPLPGRLLGHYTTTKGGNVRIDSLTTNEVMDMRIFWHEGVAYTIPPWARHLNTGI